MANSQVFIPTKKFDEGIRASGSKATSHFLTGLKSFLESDFIHNVSFDQIQ